MTDGKNPAAPQPVSETPTKPEPLSAIDDRLTDDVLDAGILFLGFVGDDHGVALLEGAKVDDATRSHLVACLARLMSASDAYGLAGGR